MQVRQGKRVFPDRSLVLLNDLGETEFNTVLRSRWQAEQKMKKAIIYARYSCDSQTEQSIEGQVRVCRDYAKQNDILIVDEYIDRATTGTNDNRVSFQQMLHDSCKKQWTMVLVYKLDRFARNKFDSAWNQAKRR